MVSEDAVEVARNIRTLSYGEWTDVLDRMFYLCCSDCGSSSGVFIKQTGIEMYRIRVNHEEQLTQATRENNLDRWPLYAEILKLREDHKQLQHRVNEALKWIAQNGTYGFHHTLELILKGDLT
jgi:hypothetical protein